MAERVLAELVGNIAHVAVEVGTAVQEGDTLVVIESMKMEIPVQAEVGGTVRTLGVGVGDVVQRGDLIAVLE